LKINRLENTNYYQKQQIVNQINIDLRITYKLTILFLFCCFASFFQTNQGCGSSSGPKDTMTHPSNAVAQSTDKKSSAKSKATAATTTTTAIVPPQSSTDAPQKQAQEIKNNNNTTSSVTAAATTVSAAGHQQTTKLNTNDTSSLTTPSTVQSAIAAKTAQHPNVSSSTDSSQSPIVSAAVHPVSTMPNAVDKAKSNMTMKPAGTAAAAAVAAATPHPGGHVTPSAAQAAALAALPPHKRYEFLPGTLGKGHFAKVKKVRDIVTQTYYACKIIDKKEMIKNAAIVKAEIDILKAVGQHANIVSLIDSFEDSQRYYLIMVSITF
jgi:hypothetical protein